MVPFDRVAHVTVVIFACQVLAPSASRADGYPWLKLATVSRTLHDGVQPPDGFKRIEVGKRSFAAWLRGLPLKPAGSRVRLYGGRLKGNQRAHHAVVDMDVRRWQQCADAIMRLRAEYLWSIGQQGKIGFHFTNGMWAPWSKYNQGFRVRLKGHRTRWVKTAGADSSRKAFHRYLRLVYCYAGTASFRRDLRKRRALDDLAPGDVLNQSARRGSYGHAVLVLDMAENRKGDRIILLGQSYMPAQDFHVLKNPRDARLSPWYRAKDLRMGLKTPEWRPFKLRNLHRFP